MCSSDLGRIAGHFGLNNFIMFFDSNDVQLSTKTAEVTSEDTALKYQSWGWKVITIDGHDHEAIREALKKAYSETEQPTLIIGKTIMGKGCVDADGNKYEGHTELHGKPIGATGADFNKTLANLGTDVDNPFIVRNDVSAHYSKVLEQKHADAKDRKRQELVWKKENPALATKLAQFLAGNLPVD